MSATNKAYQDFVSRVGQAIHEYEEIVSQQGDSEAALDCFREKVFSDITKFFMVCDFSEMKDEISERMPDIENEFCKRLSRPERINKIVLRKLQGDEAAKVLLDMCFKKKLKQKIEFCDVTVEDFVRCLYVAVEKSEEAMANFLEHCGRSESEREIKNAALLSKLVDDGSVSGVSALLYIMVKAAGCSFEDAGGFLKDNGYIESKSPRKYAERLVKEVSSILSGEAPAKKGDKSRKISDIADAALVPILRLEDIVHDFMEKPDLLLHALPELTKNLKEYQLIKAVRRDPSVLHGTKDSANFIRLGVKGAEKGIWAVLEGLKSGKLSRLDAGEKLCDLIGPQNAFFGKYIGALKASMLMEKQEYRSATSILKESLKSIEKDGANKTLTAAGIIRYGMSDFFRLFVLLELIHCGIELSIRDGQSPTDIEDYLDLAEELSGSVGVAKKSVLFERMAFACLRGDKDEIAQTAEAYRQESGSLKMAYEPVRALDYHFSGQLDLIEDIFEKTTKNFLTSPAHRATATA